MTAIILLKYYLVDKQFVDLKHLYNDNEQPKYKWDAVISLVIGALFAMIQIDLAWMVGFAVSWICYTIFNYKKIFNN